jgi:hypothetical protein
MFSSTWHLVTLSLALRHLEIWVMTSPGRVGLHKQSPQDKGYTKKGFNNRIWMTWYKVLQLPIRNIIISRLSLLFFSLHKNVKRNYENFGEDSLTKAQFSSPITNDSQQ